MKLYNAKITQISDKGVRVTGYRLEEPNPDDYVFGLHPETEEYEYDEEKYKSDLNNFLASKFEAWVENIQKDGAMTILTKKDVWYVVFKPKYSKTKFLHPLKIGQSCQVIKTETGCKIVELNK